MTASEEVLRKFYGGSATAHKDLSSLTDEQVRRVAKTKQPRGLFRSLLDYLDLPGTAVRSILSGEPGTALRAVGAFAMPGIVDQPEDRPDFGFFGNLATDPLVWFTGGGGGARKAIEAATRGVAGKAATRATARALARSATKKGLSAFSEGAEAILKRSATPRATPGRAYEAALLRAARSVRSDPSRLSQMLGEGLLDKGGLKFGLPFTEGRTILGEGRNVSIAQASPLYWAGKKILDVAGKTPTFQKAQLYGRKLLGRIYPGYGMTETGRFLQAQSAATRRKLTSEYADTMTDIARDLKTEAAAEDFHQVLTGRDLRGSGVVDIDSFRQVHPNADIDAAFSKWKKYVDTMKDDLVKRGIWQPDVPEEVVQRRLAHLFPDEAHALIQENARRAKEGLPALKLGGEGVVEAFERKVIHSATSHDEARAWASAFRKENKGIAGVKVRRRPGAGVQPWEVTVRGPDKVSVDLSTLKLPETLAYAPQQLSDDALSKLDQINIEAELAGSRGTMNPRGTADPKGTGNVFMGERKFAQDDFMDFAEEVAPGAKPLQEQNIVKLGMKRGAAHARTMADWEMVRSAKRFLGDERNVGRFENEVDALNAIDAARSSAKTPAERASYAIEQSGDGWRVFQRGDMSLRDKVFADWIKAGRGRIAPRQGLMKALNFWNQKIFKPYVTIGIGPIPNPAFHTRNLVSGIWMAASHPKVGLASGLKHTVQVLYDGLARAVEAMPGMPRMPRSTLTRILRGDAKNVLVDGTRFTEAEVAAMLRQHGVTRHSFPRMEEMLDELAPLGASAKSGVLGSTKKVAKALVSTKIPGKVAEFIEDRMRAQAFVAALKRGLLPDDAARVVRDAFLDYEMVSAAHRNLRDIIPFAQFTIGQTPRTIETLLHRPRVLAPLTATGFGERGGIVPTWVAEQPFLPMGRDTEGNPSYAVGASTPFEDITRFHAGSVPRTLQRAAGSLTPPLKALAETISGKDLYFGSETGSYRAETPFTSILPDAVAGRKERAIETKGGAKNITEVSPTLHKALSYLPVSRQISMMNQLFDSRRTTWHKTIALLTGIKVVSVDEERELRKIIGSYLKEKAEAGDVGSFQKFFSTGDSDRELSSLIKAYYAAKRK